MAIRLSSVAANGDRMDHTGSAAEGKEKEIVIIKWRDILSCSGWEKAEDVECPTVYSVGWLISQTDLTVKIASTLDYEDFSGEAKNEDKYHRDSSLPMSMGMHKLYDFFKFTILPDGTISVLDKNFWDELTKLDGQAVLGWREENARFCRNSQVFSRAA